jgi:hypothetical protein
VGDEWQGTRAGQAGYLIAVVREDDGMPYIEFNQGDMHPVVMARCLQVGIDIMVANQAAKTAVAVTGKTTDDDLG